MREPELEEMIREGHEMLSNGLYQTAIGYFKQVLQDDPNCMEALWGIGQAFKASANYSQAVTSFSDTFRLGDTGMKYEAAIQIGSCYSLLGRFGEASDWFFKAVSLDPSQPYAYAQLFWHYFHHQKCSESEAFAQKALQADADYLPAYGMLALVAIVWGKLDVATDYLNHLITHHASDLVIAFVNGRLSEAKGRYDEAIFAYKRVIQSDTEGSITYDHLARCLCRVGRAEEAQAMLEQLLEARPNDYLPYLYLGRHFMRVRSSARALKLFEKALDVNSDHPILYYLAASACIRLLRFRKSAEYLEKAIEIYEKNHLDDIEDYYNSLAGAFVSNLLCLRWRKASQWLKKIKEAFV